MINLSKNSQVYKKCSKALEEKLNEVKEILYNSDVSTEKFKETLQLLDEFYVDTRAKLRGQFKSKEAMFLIVNHSQNTFNMVINKIYSENYANEFNETI